MHERALQYKKKYPAEVYGAYHYIYCGDEFCELRLPSVEEVRNIHETYVGRDQMMVLVLPYVTNKGVKRCEQVLQYMRDYVDMYEVVINDWGLLPVVYHEAERGRVIAGRLLVSRYYSQVHMDRHRNEGMFPATFIEFLRECKIDRLEFNALRHVQVVHDQLMHEGIKAHLYVPFSYTTTSRYCSSACGYTRHDHTPQSQCTKPCEQSWGCVSDNRFAEGLVLDGNTYHRYHDVREADLDSIDRVITNDSGRFKSALSGVKEVQND